MTGKRQKNKTTTTKRIVWLCLVNGLLWVWCSYILAFFGREVIAETLSQVALTEIIAVVLSYCVKSLFEKRKDFGSVGTDDSKTKGDDSDEDE